MRPMRTIRILIFVYAILSASSVHAQTSAFNCQGHLSNNAAAANGTYDFRFALFNALASGSPVGSILTKTGVTVTGGVFTVSLDFGGNAFPGADRYLEISVKKSSDVSYIILTPRQQITSSPYSIRTLNATFADSILVQTRTIRRCVRRAPP